MAYSDILKLKKVNETSEEKIFIKNLVAGSDVFAIDLCHHLNIKEANSTKLLSSEKITNENLKLFGPSLVRGQVNIDIIKALKIEGSESYSIFYKDMKFHKFGKRTKPQPMLWGEEWFSQNHMKIDIKDILPALMEDNIIEKMRENILEINISKIEKAIPEDLIDRANFKVTCSNGLTIECENLYYAYTPDSFYELYKNKKELTDKFVEFCESTKTPCALYFHLELENIITESQKTYFFPLSFTHDWGHFVGEFETEGDKQICKFVTFINKEENSEEDISKKLRLLKKNLEKKFNDFSDKKCREYVLLKENAYCPKIDDSLLIDAKDNVENLKFISFNAPILDKLSEIESFEDSWSSSNMLARAALVQRIIKSS